jgi:hypothetical protein
MTAVLCFMLGLSIGASAGFVIAKVIRGGSDAVEADEPMEFQPRDDRWGGVA